MSWTPYATRTRLRTVFDGAANRPPGLTAAWPGGTDSAPIGGEPGGVRFTDTTSKAALAPPAAGLCATMAVALPAMARIAMTAGTRKLFTPSLLAECRVPRLPECALESSTPPPDIRPTATLAVSFPCRGRPLGRPRRSLADLKVGLYSKSKML